MKVATTLFAVGILLSTPSAAENGDSRAVELAAAMTGTFATRADAPGTAFADFRTAIPPLGDGEWIYFQRNQGAEMQVYRQRVLQLVDRPDGSVAQITYTIAEPERFASAPDDATALNALSAADVTALLNQGCEQHWRFDAERDGGSWVGRVDPNSCTIYSQRRQTEIRIGSETRLTGDALYEAERGFDLEGNQLWGTPAGEFSTIYRVQ
ncbi:hypothetical protein HFP51_01310 [Parasphingopyxis sp. CP4]|uniref:chromophore lyase CpcT/CpeT n=1 Tax=Parasphingopyxis sp. CP4 TaxID=2724527 RepID=UPI0015A256D5|nr:chromophore lyase CpcT/CpeT [Parasphingopyxis sp. CP4]QLC20942.1 hypothetical protein HFP51_01310 [Parasphingopyxis sp. CP4]